MLSNVASLNTITTSSNTEQPIHPLVLAGPYPNIFYMLLNKYNHQISIFDQGSILKKISKNGHTKSVKILLKKHGKNITDYAKIKVLCHAARDNQPDIITVLLKYCIDDISVPNQILALRLAAKNAHLEALEALLKYESILNHLNNPWLRKTPLYEAQVQLIIAKTEKEKIGYQTIINRLMQIPAIALFESIRKKIDDYLIKPKEENALFDNVVDKIRKTDDKILKYFLQQIAFDYALDEYDEYNKIKINDEEKLEYYNSITLEPDQINDFLKNTKPWQIQERIQERYNNLEKSDEKYDYLKYKRSFDTYSFYVKFSVFCLNNSVYTFAATIYENAELQLKKHTSPIIFSYDKLTDKKLMTNTSSNVDKNADRIFKRFI